MTNRILWTSALLVSTLGTLAVTGCKNNAPAPGEAPIVDGNASATDPAAVNMASLGTQVAGRSFAGTQQVSSESYPQQAQASPGQAGGNYGVGNSQQNEAYQYNTQAPANAGDPNGQYDPNANASEYEQYSSLLDPDVPAADQAPPPLPSDYEQPEAPGPDYLWTPGYWDYATAGYYYVPGAWVGAPYAGALWTPGWWGFIGNRYRWHHGYWGEHVGYYGGINYGFGYAGYGYQGGYWNNNRFFYNTAVLRVNPRFVNNNVYRRNVTVDNRSFINNSRTSYVGGNGGLRRGPAPQERAALREPRTGPMQSQMQNRQAAGENRQQFFSANKGRPQTLAAARPMAADRNVQAPPRTAPGQSFGNGARPGVENRPGGAINNPQQRGPVEQQRNEQVQNQQRDQQNQQRDFQNQRNQQLGNQRIQPEQQRNEQMQNQQRDQQVQNQQRNQQMQQQQREQQVQNQQRNQQMQNQQRDQQANAQRQQMQQQQQRVQQDQQRMQQQHVQQQQQSRPAPQAPRMEAPHPAPQAPHGGGEHR